MKRRLTLGEVLECVSLCEGKKMKIIGFDKGVEGSDECWISHGGSHRLSEAESCEVCQRIKKRYKNGKE
jgi:hypothetical protein